MPPPLMRTTGTDGLYVREKKKRGLILLLLKDLFQKFCTYVTGGFTFFFAIVMCFEGVCSGRILGLLVVVL